MEAELHRYLWPRLWLAFAAAAVIYRWIGWQVTTPAQLEILDPLAATLAIFAFPIALLLSLELYASQQASERGR
jgi:hypothetical protein